MWLVSFLQAFLWCFFLIKLEMLVFFRLRTQLWRNVLGTRQKKKSVRNLFAPVLLLGKKTWPTATFRRRTPLPPTIILRTQPTVSPLPSSPGHLSQELYRTSAVSSPPSGSTLKTGEEIKRSKLLTISPVKLLMMNVPMLSTPMMNQSMKMLVLMIMMKLLTRWQLKMILKRLMMN